MSKSKLLLRLIKRWQGPIYWQKWEWERLQVRLARMNNELPEVSWKVPLCFQAVFFHLRNLWRKRVHQYSRNTSPRINGALVSLLHPTHSVWIPRGSNSLCWILFILYLFLNIIFHFVFTMGWSYLRDVFIR